MAGLSSRFRKAGYTLPKYMLEAHGITLFEHSVESFQKYFSTEKFLFIALDVFNTKQFIEEKVNLMKIKNYEIAILEQPTRGQAETVFLGLNNSSILDEPITIFNIDTFRPNFQFPTEFDIKQVDGYLETFIGEGKNWSNVLPVEEGSNKVQLTAEKKEISHYCCTGLYYWKSSKDFCRIFEKYLKKSLEEVDAGEYYIAPMYNDLIEEGKDIRFSIINKSDVIFCGVPSEYQDFLSK
jgi:NDP-sugar pyrophosphorylase family protein